MVVAAYNAKDSAAVKRIHGICWGEIARQFLASEDEPQLQYIANTKVMLGRVLRSHGVVTAAGEDFMLNVRVKLIPKQVRDLVRLCDRKILQYEQSYGIKSICGTAGLPVPRISPGLCSTRCSRG